MGKKAPAAAGLPNAAATDPLLGLSVRPLDTEIQRPTFSERRTKYGAMPTVEAAASMALNAAQSIDILQATVARDDVSAVVVSAVARRVVEDMVLLHECLERGARAELGHLHSSPVQFAGREAASWTELAYVLLVWRFLAVFAVVDGPAMIRWTATARPEINDLEPQAVVANWSGIRATILGLPLVDTVGLSLRVEKEWERFCQFGPRCKDAVAKDGEGLVDASGGHRADKKSRKRIVPVYNQLALDHPDWSEEQVRNATANMAETSLQGVRQALSRDRCEKKRSL